MICPTCQKETPHNAFCGNCGAELPADANPYSNRAVAPEPRAKDNAWAGIVALICGGLSVLFCFTVFGGFVLGVAAIVFGVISVKSENRGLAIGGIICGAAGILFSLLAILLALGFTVNIFQGVLHRMPEITKEFRYYLP